MAQVFRCRVLSGDKVMTVMETGESVMVEGEPFVRMYDGRYMTSMTPDWHYSKADAERAAVTQLRRMLQEINDVILGLIRPTTADKGLHSSAPVVAQAEVAS